MITDDFDFGDLLRNFSGSRRADWWEDLPLAEREAAIERRMAAIVGTMPKCAVEYLHLIEARDAARAAVRREG